MYIHSVRDFTHYMQKDNAKVLQMLEEPLSIQCALVLFNDMTRLWIESDSGI